ncbi:Transmembrane protein 50A [Trichoplax sp. H2]|uniref:Transmembrane protein 50A n=1 Tax=Trichoplax adhaerens TaxID=10228 RepID=B3RS80_TRIAD|nr:hypothetical protein TRIADDRAFT_54503 [Trichoplax adhaerens]EDV26469.1 hypothetical protein TRIADDRAFT_54503 [Trichoplax adhaerens]RDD46404.1 Transmembrane protein 50A [Trichoplax sp. H2]|eukprot:XP_002110465.1 hypothetical protein TRIADDRAFT_54503 [Trichoplax adhaerens]
MSGCLDDIRCIECDIGEYRNPIAASIAGVLGAAGWWVFIDAATTDQFNPAFCVCGIVSMVGLLMINAISTGQLHGDAYSGGCLGQTGSRIWFIFGFGCLFGGLISSGWILFASYVVPHAKDVWPGVAVFLQNVLLFFSALTFKFGRTEDPYRF